jgi:hypothetical protein
MRVTERAVVRVPFHFAICRKLSPSCKHNKEQQRQEVMVQQCASAYCDNVLELHAGQRPNQYTTALSSNTAPCSSAGKQANVYIVVHRLLQLFALKLHVICLQPCRKQRCGRCMQATACRTVAQGIMPLPTTMLDVHASNCLRDRCTETSAACYST